MSELQLADECSGETDEDTAPASRASKFARKSGRLRIADDVVVKDFEWPHYDVYRGQRRRPAQYEELKIQEFCCGYLATTIDSSTPVGTHDLMLTHLQTSMRDAIDFSWDSVRN